MKRQLPLFCLFILIATAAAQTAKAGDVVDPNSVRSRAAAALSQIRGTLRVTGLQQPVTVLRDRWGVAHIYAHNQHDLFFAQGFVAAQDRLFQMELWKRSGQGRLAEILGPSALLRDVNARLLSYRGDMKAEYESYSPDTREILESFTAGINAYIANRLADGGPGLPLEFQLAAFKPEPWKPEDCLNRMAAFSMTGNAFHELAHAQVVSAAGAGAASRLFDFDPAVGLDPAPGTDLRGLSPSLLQYLVGSDRRIEFSRHPSEGSNNWTVSGQLTRSGKPLLANDPHRVIAEPSLRYMVHLVAPGWDVIGAGEPGLPGVALGHNQSIAWGFTIFGLDQQDLYLEELNPANSAQYKTAGGWESMEVHKETIGIRGGPSVQVELEFTRHGPVLWEDGRRALALRWVGAEAGTAGYLGSLAVDRAQNWQQFEAAMPRWKVPSENIVYADREGNIGEHSAGLAPRRENWTGLLPVPGAGGYEWSGFVPTTELPYQFNPAAGFVVTANHKMIPDGYPYKVGYSWTDPYRFERITQVLQQAKAGQKLDVAAMQRLQSDVRSLPALELIALLRTAVVHEQPNPAAQLLLQWDGELARDSAAAALFEVWLQRLTSAAMNQFVPAAARPLLEDWSPHQLLKFLKSGDGSSVDASASERDHLLFGSLQEAWVEMEHRQGPDPAKWSWGEMHQVHFRHPLDQADEAKAVMDPGPLARPGDEYTVNATGYSGTSFDQDSGASYREILDLSDWDNSVAVNVPGQSGQPGSPHYSDLLPLWSEGRYFPLVYSREAVEQETTDRLVLQP
ncbi:MAG TPA: penicillin acylase family protein [Terriglobales bacterium]|jgi:penicillin amidase|nr:penicillin acylase family protein [Terriglobales bacterium]